MSRVTRSPVAVLVVVLIGLFLAHDLGAKQSLDGSAFVLSPGVVRIKYVPDPNDIVNLAEGTPYTVPDGMVLIITDYTVTNPTTGGNYKYAMTPRIRINGTDVWGTGWGDPGGSPGNPLPTGNLSHGLQSGVRAAAGNTVTLHANWATNSTSSWNVDLYMPDVPQMFASGYLAKAH
jgi:hypothetical protein